MLFSLTQTNTYLVYTYAHPRLTQPATLIIIFLRFYIETADTPVEKEQRRCNTTHTHTHTLLNRFL